MSLYGKLNGFMASVAPTLRGTISFMCDKPPVDCLLTRDQLTAGPIEPARSIGRGDSKRLAYVPRSPKIIRVGQKEGK